MKTIIVLTDFSKNALIAAEQAALLAGKLNANLLLLYTEGGVPVSTSYPDVFYKEGDDSSKQHCEREMDKIKHHLSRLFSFTDRSQYKPMISGMVSQKGLGAQLVDLMKNGDIEMMVMGAATGIKMKSVLSETAVYSMIQSLGCKVLVFPESGAINVLDRILFARQYNKADVFAPEYLIELGKRFEDQLETDNEIIL